MKHTKTAYELGEAMVDAGAGHEIALNGVVYRKVWLNSGKLPSGFSTCDHCPLGVAQNPGTTVSNSPCAHISSDYGRGIVCDTNMGDDYGGAIFRVDEIPGLTLRGVLR